MDQLYCPAAMNHSVIKNATERGKDPVDMDVSSLNYRPSATSSDGLALVKRSEQRTKSPTVSKSPSLSPSPRPSKLASKVRLIDGVVSKILHKGDTLLGDLFSKILENKANSALPILLDTELQTTSLNAGPTGGSL